MRDGSFELYDRYERRTLRFDQDYPFGVDDDSFTVLEVLNVNGPANTFLALVRVSGVRSVEAGEEE